MSDDITMEIYEYLEQKEQFKTYQEARLWCATGLIEFKVYDFNTNYINISEFEKFVLMDSVDMSRSYKPTEGISNLKLLVVTVSHDFETEEVKFICNIPSKYEKIICQEIANRYNAEVLPYRI